MDSRLATPIRALQLAIGLTATLAGVDKFLNILANWGSYVSRMAVRLLPFGVGTLMAIVGGVEVAVGAAVLACAIEVRALAPALGAIASSARVATA